MRDLVKIELESEIIKHFQSKEQINPQTTQPTEEIRAMIEMFGSKVQSMMKIRDESSQAVDNENIKIMRETWDQASERVKDTLAKFKV
jgi:hypothetical protein